MPNRAQAFVAALIQVTNTTANPVPNWGVAAVIQALDDLVEAVGLKAA